jgi:Domain of unknown function (DUF4328)/Septum formation
MSDIPLPPPIAPAPPWVATVEFANRYRSPSRPANALRCCLIGVMLISALDAAALTAAHQLVGRMLSEPGAVDPDAVTDIDRWTVVTAIGQGALIVLAFGLLVAWTSRIYRNLPVFGVRNLRFSEGWAIGAWFVPLLNLVRPKAIIDDCWRGSGADEGLPAPSRRGRGVPALVHWWWAVRILAWFLGLGAGAEPARLEDLRSGAATAVVGDVVVIVACVLEIAVVTRLTDRQRTRIVPAARDRERTWTLVVCGALVLALAAFVGGLAAVARPTTGSASDGHRRAFAMSLVVGECFDVPPDVGEVGTDDVELLDVEVMPCEEPHEHEVVSVFDHEAASGVPYPGIDGLTSDATDQCIADFETWVGSSFEDSSLGILVLGPSEHGWSLDDRTLLCITGRIDGRKLDHSVRASRMRAGRR